MVLDFGDADSSSTSTSRNPFFVYPDSGYYNVCLVATNLAGSDTFCTELIIGDTVASSISNNFESYDLNLFPNPANEVINLTWNSKAFADAVIIRDLTGREINRTNIQNGAQSARINLDLFKSGYFIVELKRDQQTISTKRFVKY